MHLIQYTLRVVFFVIALCLAIIGVLSVTRSTPVHTVIAPGPSREPPGVGDTLFGETMELYTGTHLSAGNKVEILLNGNETYARLWRDIASAKHSITVQMYYALPGAVTDSMVTHLVERSRANIPVALLLDAFGAADLRKTKVLDTLRAAGVRVAWLRPLRWYTLSRAATRSHARVVVVDGRIGYTGGFGLADYWLGDGLRPGQWRETNARFEGPAVAALQAAFVAGWAEATGVLLTGSVVLPKRAFASAGNVTAGLMHTMPSVGSTPAERFFALSIASARRTLYITNSYFVPDIDFRNLLKAAARRGVDVRILTVGKTTDVKTTWLAGRAYYEDLLEAGVRIYEYQPTMMHGKTLVVDGMWSSVGSMNFDNRSMAFNNETNLVALSAEVGARLDSVFMADIAHSKEITAAEFANRALSQKIAEWSAEKLWRVL